jgi:hypothetical protein
MWVVHRSPLFEIARVLVRLDHVASIIVKGGSQSHAIDFESSRTRLRG